MSKRLLTMPRHRFTDTRDRIEKAAIRLFVEKGVAETSVRDIARAVDISEGALYRHFVSKDELVWARLRTPLRGVRGPARRRSPRAETTARGKLAAMIRGFCQAHDENPTLFRFLLFVQHGQLSKLAPGTPTPVDAVRTCSSAASRRRRFPTSIRISPRHSSSASCCSRSPLPPTAGCPPRWTSMCDRLVAAAWAAVTIGLEEIVSCDRHSSSFLTARRFAPLFVTQFLGAFNDNLLKSALGIVVTFRLAEQSGLDSASLVMLAGAVFIAPFFLFSGASGTLADRVDKSLIARIVKVAEIGIMTLGAVGLWQDSVPLLFAALFCLGTHSTVFGPIKYALLPQHLRDDELVAGNALIEAGHVPRDPVRHDPRRQRGPARQRGAHRGRLRRRLCVPGLACRASDPAARHPRLPMRLARACCATRSPSSVT